MKKMKYRKTIIFLIVAIFIFSITAVSASDMNDTAINSDDTSQMGLTASNNVDNLKLSEENTTPVYANNVESVGDGIDSTVMSEGFGTYSGLAEEIGHGGNIELKHAYYTYNTGYTIDIRVDYSVIDGRGAVIDMAGSYVRAFYVSGSGVIIKNLTIKNAKHEFNDGGAIYFNYPGTVTNCNFSNNAAFAGGAVYFNNSGAVSNCSFTYNVATYYSGAVYFNNSGAVTNCNFIGNNAAFAGGAVGFIKEGTVMDCNFVNNSAEYRGGAIWMQSGGVENSNFVNNTANDRGGAINMVSGTVTYSNFANNKASRIGGAVYVYRTGIVTNCDFTNNYAPSGGAIYVYQNITEIIGSRFTNNAANSGGAIYWNNSADGVVSGCIFVNNTAENGNGIIHFHNNDRGTNLTVNNNVFLNNNNGYEIYFDKGDELSNVDFNWFGNNATNAGSVPKMANVASDVWLFLNATAQPDVIVISGKSDITFKLYAYNKTTGKVSEYDNALLIPLNLTLTSTNGKTNVETVKPGDVAEYTATDFGTGSVTATIEKATYTIEFKAKYDPQLAVESLEIPYSESINLTLDYNTTASGKVNITLNGKKYNMTFTNVDLNRTITLENILPDAYNVTVAYSGDDNFINATANATWTVSKLNTNITCDSITTVYNSNDGLTITLKDSTGKDLSSVKVTVDLNGAKTYTTDKKGQVKITTKGLSPKTYTAKITFNGTTNYDKTTKDVKIIVKKATPKLTAKKKTFKNSVKTKKYIITLKDNTGRAIKKTKVTLKVKGKTYKATTNSKGKATFKIKKLNKKGTYKAKVTYKGNKYYKKLSKKVKIKVNITFKTVAKGSKDKSTVKKIQQALKGHGYYLSYKGHYLIVDGKYKSCTKRSVKEFQHDNGLKITGKVDEKTAKKLGLI